MIRKLWIKFLIFIFGNCLILINCNAAQHDCIILLHGLGRTHYSMSSLETILKKKDYVVVNYDYPSTKETIENIARQYIPFMINQCLINHSTRINFVTHSMGGIVLRKYLQTHNISQLSRIVMLAPPNHGSQLADLLHNFWLYKFLMGPAGQELLTHETSLPNKIDNTKQHYQVGVIAGSFSMMPFNNAIFHEQNDGKVSVSSTKLTVMKDFIVIPVGHTFMMNNASVQKQILSFLNYGKFIH